jgi:hypothetical protein
MSRGIAENHSNRRETKYPEVVTWLALNTVSTEASHTVESAGVPHAPVLRVLGDRRFALMFLGEYSKLRLDNRSFSARR